MSSTTFLNPVFNTLQHMDYNKSSILLQDGNEVDNSWELKIVINSVGELVVRVNGLYTIGSVMHSIAEQTEGYQMNWSDYALWWSQKNIWLLQTRRTLDQYNIQSDALLEFRPVHGKLRIVLPSLKTIDLNVNYSSRVFQVVVKVCKTLNIRYPEELSLMYPVKKNDLRVNVTQPVIGHGRINNNHYGIDRNNKSDHVTRQPNHQTPLTPIVSSGFNTLRSNNLSIGDLSTFNRGSERFLSNPNSLDLDQIDTHQYSLCSFRMKPSLAFYEGWIQRPKNVIAKSRMNHGWLDSSRSLMEHGIRPCNNDHNTPILYLRFKYNMFYDLNPKYDTVRIHQIYEQARWDILSGNIDCTEDEMILFAAYQLQAEFATTNSHLHDFSDIYVGTIQRSPYANSINGQLDTFDTRHNANSSSNSGTNMNHIKDYEDEIDYLLNEIEDSCGIGVNEIRDSQLNMNKSPNFYNSQTPVLEGNLKVCREKINFLMKRYKNLFIRLQDANIHGFKRDSDKFPIFSYTLKDCSITQDVDCNSDKYIINLNLLSDQLDMSSTYDLDKGSRLQREQLSIKFDNDEEFAKWIAAFKLGSMGRTIASVDAYQKERRNTLDLLKLQLNKVNLEAFDPELAGMLNDLSFYCVDRVIAKAKSIDYLKQRILKAHIGMDDLNVNSAKLKYISSWQRLPTFGKNYFLVQFDRNNTIDPVRGTNHLFSNSEGVLIAISHGRFEILSSTTGEVLRSWNFSEFKSWTVNWQSNRITLHFNNGKTEFRPLIGSCKTVIEFIGGFVFLSQRTPEKNQELNERFFHKLTGVTDLEQISLGEK